MIQRIAKVNHPKTGKPLQPVFTSKTGRVYWPILGAADDNDDDDKSEDDDSGDKSEDDNDDDGSKSSEDSKDKSKGDDKSKVSQSDLDAVTERMKAADRRAADAEKKLKDIEDAKKDDLTKATDKVTEHETTIKSLQEANDGLRLDNAFALNNSFRWHDPAVVMDLVRKRDDVTIDDDGNVKGMDNALKAIAKDKPYLVKDSEDDEEDEDGPPKSGSRTGQGSGKDKKPDEKRLRGHYRI